MRALARLHLLNLVHGLMLDLQKIGKGSGFWCFLGVEGAKAKKGRKTSKMVIFGGRGGSKTHFTEGENQQLYRIEYT